MGDFGIKVSQPGKDAQDSGDKDLLFSSSWPNLKVLFNGRITATTREIVDPGVSSGVVLKHNLGYVPFFIPYIPNDTTGFSIFRQFLSVDKKNIYISAGSGSAAQLSFDVALMVFELDIEKNLKAPNIDTGTSSTSRGNGDIGIRMSKSGKDISSKDLRDYIIHSRTRSPMVHEVVNGPVNDGSNFTYTHDLPYNPFFFSFIECNGITLGPDGAYGMNNGFAGLEAIGNTISITNHPSKNLAYPNPRTSFVILKDPFTLDDSMNKVVV